MRRGVRLRFWVEAAAAAVSGTLLVLTLLWREWIELIFGVDPDNGSGALEWAIVAASAVVTVALFAAARVEWRRTEIAPA